MQNTPLAIKLPLVKDHCNISSNKTTIKLLDRTNQEKVGFTLGKEGEKKDEEMKRADKERTSRQRDEVGICVLWVKYQWECPGTYAEENLRIRKLAFQHGVACNTMM